MVAFSIERTVSDGIFLRSSKKTSSFQSGRDRVSARMRVERWEVLGGKGEGGKRKLVWDWCSLSSRLSLKERSDEVEGRSEGLAVVFLQGERSQGEELKYVGFADSGDSEMEVESTGALDDLQVGEEAKERKEGSSGTEDGALKFEGSEGSYRSRREVKDVASICPVGDAKGAEERR